MTLTRSTWRLRYRELPAALPVWAGLMGYVVVVYVVVVLGGGALIGHTSSPHVGLSVLATAVVALTFERVQTILERSLSRFLGPHRPSPYDVLTRLSRTTSSYPPGQLPTRMAMVLADGTGAEWTQVWLVVQGRLQLAATWPLDAETDQAWQGEPDLPGYRSAPVRQAGDLLGVLRLREREGEPLTPVEERLFAGLAAQSGLVLRGVRLRAERERRLEELSARAEELQRSRERLVDTQDAERRRLERDIHDGAQQHLVALSVNLRLAQTLVERSPERAVDVLGEQSGAAHEAIRTVTTLSRGIYPRALSDAGLGEALHAATEASPIPVDVRARGLGRYAAHIEAAVYFCCLEAIQNSAKHSGANRVWVDVRDESASLVLLVEDDGQGFDLQAMAPGVGIANMRDRIESVGGVLTVESRSGGGTRVEARVPVPHLPRPRTEAD